MVRKILSKVAGFFALGWLAATPSLAVNKGDLPALPLSELHKIDSVVGDGETAKGSLSNGALQRVALRSFKTSG